MIKQVTKVLLMICTVFMVSCGESSIKDVAAFDINGAWYWIAQFDEDANSEDIMQYVKMYANPTQTSYFFFYSDDTDLEARGLSDLRQEGVIDFITSDPEPDFGFYMMPNDTQIYHDPLELLKLSKQ